MRRVLTPLLAAAALAGPAPAQPPAPVLPINLATALQLANVRPLDIELATHRLEAEAARLRRANVLWLPTVFLGVDYYRHDGPIQRAEGQIVDTGRSTLMVGAGPFLVLSTSDALFEPLAARRNVEARRADVAAAANDALVAVTDAYFAVQQARGEHAGALANLKDTLELDRIVNGPSKEFAPPPSIIRGRVETYRRRQLVVAADERARVAGAELARVLRLDPAARPKPVEPPEMMVALLDPSSELPALLPLAAANRPELASRSAVVRATGERARQEALRPLLPNVLVRSNSTTPSNTLGFGWFGGGRHDHVGNFGLRGDIDVQVVWEFQNAGLGNLARRDERRAENRAAVAELLRQQDRVAAEVSQALAQLQSAAARVGDAEAALKDGVELVRISLEGVQTTRKSASGRELIVRPQEVVAAIQARGQAIVDYYGAVADYNRSQFRLYRALGYPARELAGRELPTTTPPKE